MDNHQFLNECKKYIDDVYTEFQNYQAAVMDILEQVVDICKKENIRYFLAFGTLLGYIRDGGGIPWDYDIDIMIMHEDFDKFKLALLSDLPKEYYYAYTDTVNNYPTNCLRVCKRKYPLTSIHVDVYFLIGLPDDASDRKRYIHKVNNISLKRSEKYGNEWFVNERTTANFYTKLAVKYHKLRTMFLTSQRLMRKEKKIYSKYDSVSTSYLYSVGDPYKIEYKREWFRNDYTIHSSNKEFNVPEGYKEILTKLYGNYMNYLPIEERFDEFYKMVKIVRMRNDNYNKMLQTGDEDSAVMK